MATFTKFYQFVEDLAEKVHNLGSDALKIALTAAADEPDQTDAILSDITEIAYTNLSTTSSSPRRARLPRSSSSSFTTTRRPHRSIHLSGTTIMDRL